MAAQKKATDGAGRRARRGRRANTTDADGMILLVFALIIAGAATILLRTVSN